MGAALWYVESPMTPGTDWFAVDGDGHLAHLSAGISGAVPGGAGRGAGSFPTVMAAVSRVASITQPVHELEGRLLPGLEAAGDDLHAATGAGPALVFLPGIDLISRELAEGLAEPVRASFGAAAIFDRLPRATSQRLHAPGGCLACFSEPADETRVDPSRFGLFSYGHLCDSWIAGPYGRRTRPSAALLVHQLPPALKPAFTAFRFDHLCFADEPYLQPLDHFRCHATPPAYLAADGKTVRPIRGRELEYRQFFFPRHKRDPRFLVERPPD